MLTDILEMNPIEAGDGWFRTAVVQTRFPWTRRASDSTATVKNSISATRTCATFAMIYVREAHPTDGWVAESNERAGIKVSRQPGSYNERAGVARDVQPGPRPGEAHARRHDRRQGRWTL